MLETKPSFAPGRSRGSSAVVTRSGPSVLTSNCRRAPSKSIPSGSQQDARVRDHHVRNLVAERCREGLADVLRGEVDAAITRQPTASSSGELARQVAITASPRASSCRASSSPIPRFAPVTSHVAIVSPIVADSARSTVAALAPRTASPAAAFVVYARLAADPDG